MCSSPLAGWADNPPVRLPGADREAHVRHCSGFADDALNRHPDWLEGLNERRPPGREALLEEIGQYGLDAGLRRYRNRQMLRIIWHDLCGLGTLGEVFADLTGLAEICLQAAIEHHDESLREKHGVPRDDAGEPQRLVVIGMGKFGGGELNLSSDIDVMFSYPSSGECDGRRGLANDQYFIRLARAVIASLSEITGDGFCFRVDTRLRPFGDAGPLASSLASMEQYYQREGRDWERYAMIKARPVAGDREAGAQFLRNLRPFVYRRYIDFGSVEAMHEMHANVRDDARRKDRLDDIKRGPGGIREIEFLAQCFQVLRGGRETTLQTPSLDAALTQIAALGLMPGTAVDGVREDYVYLRRLENRIQALRDQQTHRLPVGEDRERVARAMGEASAAGLDQALAAVRQRVTTRFEQIFPDQPEPSPKSRWAEQWRQLQGGRQSIDDPVEPPAGPLGHFLRQLDRLVLSQRAHDRLDRFMPALLERLDEKPLNEGLLNRVFDLVLAICRRSAYLVLLVQHPPALDRMLELFARSDWIAGKVTRFPALLDELIDPSLGRQIPAARELVNSVDRLLNAAQGTEAVLEGLNYLKLATSLRIAVAQLESSLSANRAQQALADLAAAILGGVLSLAGREIEARHGLFALDEDRSATGDRRGADMAIIAYGTLGAAELGYESDLDLVFLFDTHGDVSDGKRPLLAERYYARLAQRVLSYLTVMTPSGRLYEVDTRLRPNGRAGALVSSLNAFSEYQMKEAWTWEMQALTRARFVAGSHALQSAFERIRLDALCRPRRETELRAELLDMRHRMVRERPAEDELTGADALKHGPGGLVDIEFIAQLGILLTASSYPRVLQATGTLRQLDELARINWLPPGDAESLANTWCALSQQRMMLSLVPEEQQPAPDTKAGAELFEARVGRLDGRGQSTVAAT
jgi:glutamate-ammonia-ligase adenylyltransferase